jgi:biopolymer transport protein ExbD
MGIAAGAAKRGNFVALNVVPLIDILLVLLVIYMIIAPLKSKGLPAQIPQQSETYGHRVPAPDPGPVVVEVLNDGSLRINQQAVAWERLGERLSLIFAQRRTRIAFVKGGPANEFFRIAQVIDIMRSAGVASVGLLTPELEHGQGIV